MSGVQTATDKAGDPLLLRIDSLLREKGRSYQFQQRLRLHFHGSNVERPNGERLDLHKVDKISDDNILKWLPLVSKMSLLFQLMGVENARQALAPSSEAPLLPLPPLSKEEPVEAAEFAREIEALTDGVVTIYELDALSILRMFLFAALGKCLQRDGKVLNASILRMVNDGEITSSTGKEELVQERASLIRMFGFIGNYEQPQYFPHSASLAGDVLNHLSAFQKTLRERPDNGDRQMLNRELDRMQQLLKPIQQALRKPYHLFPLLLSRVRSMPKVECEKPVDKEHIDVSAADWLEEAVLSWEVHSQTFLPLFQKINKGVPGSRDILRLAEELEESRKALIKEARTTFNAAIAKSLQQLHEFEQLPSDLQRKGIARLKELIATTDQLSDDFDKFLGRLQQWSKNVKALTSSNRGQWPENETWQFDTDPSAQMTRKIEIELNHPMHSYFRVATAIIDSIDRRSKLFNEFYGIIDRVMTSRFKTLGSVPLVDLLQWQMRTLYDTASQTLTSRDRERLEVHRNNLDQLFGQVRRLLARQHFEQAVDIMEQAAWSSRACQLAIDANRDRNGAPESLAPLLQHYRDLGHVLNHFLIFPKGHKVLSRNPFQGKHSQALEEEFYGALYASIRGIFLSHRPQEVTQQLSVLLKAKVAPHEATFIEEARNLVEIFHGLSRLQQTLKKESPKQEDFKKQARAFLDQLTAITKEIDRRTEEIQLSLSLYLADAVEPSESIKELSKALPLLPEILQVMIFWPAQKLIAYLTVDEMIATEGAAAETRKKRTEERLERKKASVKALPASVQTPAPSVAPAQPAAPAAPGPLPVNPLLTTFERFEQRYRALLCSLKLSAVPEEADALLRKWESAETLLGNLALLQDLCSTVDAHGERAYFITACNLALTVHLEQTLTFFQMPGASQTARFKAQDLLKSMGIEYKWSQHAPHLLLPPVFLNQPVHTFMEEREKVIAVSSRYPAQARDKLTNSAIRACNLEKGRSVAIPQQEGIRSHYRNATKAELQAGMEASMALLDAFGAGPAVAPMGEPLTTVELEKTLAGPFSYPALDEASTRGVLLRFEGLLARIQNLRAVAFYREVEQGGLNSMQRKGTIQALLKELQMLPSLCRDILLAPEDPTQGLILAKQAWLRQAVLLESALLIILSHLPASSPQSKTHCLWEEVHNQPARYSHQLVHFTQQLRENMKLSPVSFPGPLLVETEAIAQDIEPYLKQLYRYDSKTHSPAKARLDKMRLLMRLRAQLHCGLEGWSEASIVHLDRLLNVSDSALRKSRLDALILAVLKNEAKLPLLETLEVVEEWLGIYQNLLIKTANSIR